MELRQATAEDIPAIHALDREQSPVYQHPSGYEALLQSPGTLLVLDHEGQLVSFAAFTQVLDEATLLNIAVASSQRGMGLGRRLLEAGCRAVASAGARRVLLELRESNEGARRLYEAMQFALDARREHYYPAAIPGGAREAAILMSKTLEIDSAGS